MRTQVTHDISHLTCADVFRAPGVQTPVIVRFSTVIHERGSPETLRDPRGFAVSATAAATTSPRLACAGLAASCACSDTCMAPLCCMPCRQDCCRAPRHRVSTLQACGAQVKFYTREGNWDLVGNNFPVSAAAACCWHFRLLS